MLGIDYIKGIIPPIIYPVDVHANNDPGGLKRLIDHVIIQATFLNRYLLFQEQ